MKPNTNFFAVLAAALISTSAFSAQFTADPVHSNIDFTIRHLVSKYRGSFDKFEGTFEIDDQKKTLSNVKISVVASSVNTGNQKRDDHLRSPDFFNVEKYPTIDFVSTKEAKLNKKMKLTGNITLLGKTKPVTWDVEYHGIGPNMAGGQTAGFSATTTVKRSDYGMIWNKTLDKGVVVLGDDVLLTVNLEAMPAPPAEAAAANKEQVKEQMKPSDKKKQ